MHRFPVEILTHIFRLAVEGSYASGQVKDTWAALHVICRKWYKVMLGHGAIATDIRITDEHWDVDFATHLLERSEPSGVQLTMLLSYSPRNAYTVVELQEFLETATRYHRDRIQSMVIGQSGIHTDLNDLLLRARFPVLCHLTIGPHLPRRVSLPVEDLSLQAPELMSLRLASCITLKLTAGIDHMIFPNVVKLELTGSSATFDTIDIPWDIVSIIGRLPALKYLVLADYFPRAPPPPSQRPEELSHGLAEIEYRSSKPASSVMALDALLQHETARRSLRLVRTDLHTLVDILSGRAWLATSIDDDRGKNVVNLRLRSSLSKAPGVLDIQVTDVGDYLAYVIACIPVNGVRRMQVQSVDPMQVLWQYIGHSEGLQELQVIGRSAEGFAKTFEQDLKMFSALRHVTIAGRNRRSGLAQTLSSLLRALAQRHAEGMSRLEYLALPEEMAEPPNLTGETLMSDRIEEALTPYFCLPSRFRKALGDARAILSGSWVLLFTEAHSSSTPPSWIEGDLDIFCPEDGLAIMMACLIEEGYTPADIAQNWDPPSMKTKTRTISRVLKFHHGTRGCKVDIVCTLAISPFEVVLRF
ncbi:hypothetical protein K488DRAFT_90659 [Vararia minispora EC-137]|uniref:Uncharacterized protein n=1 Tax=Vararia minispora EC-137 TaxID=1314806 RepID=A0ACB8Q7T2_9AGAM|nr:hypothetical protein K488DRAFT_90659 [Vararia minispora EC-137]